MRHLTPAGYRVMPWANGRGQTVELWREDGPDGMLWRLSLATVAEDGPFSLLPGVERNLTVIDGPGFDLVGALHLRADPLRPVAFPGDVVLAAMGVTAASQDFNVMTARRLPLPRVCVVQDGMAEPAGGLLCLFAMAPALVAGRALGRHDLVMTRTEVRVTGRVLAVGLAV
ncbi:HutD family protein [Paracoccaceae bacterium Fryx2]|nr:HutD family protein [Paracoccaceae bacterium Fryx2]